MDSNLNVAVQAPGNTQPTNKVAAAGTAAGAIGAVLVAVTSFIGPAIEENLSGVLGTNTLALVTAGVGALVGYFALKYGSQAAAYNVLDKPNVAMVPATPAVQGGTTTYTGIEENKPE